MRRQLPPWAMGLAGAPLGFYFGFISTATPILLAAHGVSVGKISEVSAWGFSPTFWAFLLCPILDVRFSKRTYAFFFAAMAAVCAGVSTLLTFHLLAFTLVLTLGCTAAVIFGNAHQGWLPDVMEDKHYSAVGGTSNIANLGAAGLFATLAIVLVRKLPALPAAGLLALTVMAPTAMLFFIPVPPVRKKSFVRIISEPWAPPSWLSGRLAPRGRRWLERELLILQRDFRGIAHSLWVPMPEWLKVFLRPIIRFLRELWVVCKRPGCILGIVCFVSPTACFALTNLFSGMGEDFHTPESLVTALNGTAVAVVCSAGCLAGIWFCSRYLRRDVYIVTGFGGAAAALGMIWAPHTLVWYATGVLVYNFFQGINYTAFTSLSLEIVGPGNPLSSTQIALLAASANLPISYMTAVDGHFHTTHGLRGMLAVDALSSVVVGTALLVVFHSLKVGKAAQAAVLAGG